jgi:hypothetical protein
MSLAQTLLAWILLWSHAPGHLGLEGRFVDLDGRPVGGVEVRVSAFRSAESEEVIHRDATAGEDRRFSVTGLPGGQRVLTARAAGFSTYQRTLGESETAPRLGDLMLTPERPTRVWVTSSGGAPLPGAHVSTFRGEITVTDEDGLAVLHDVPLTAPLRLTVTAPEHLDVTQVLAAPPPETIRLHLDRAFRVTGRLVDEYGEPLTEGRVEAAREDPDESGRIRFLRARQEGGAGFELLLAEERDYELTFAAAGARERRLELTTGPAGETEGLGDLELNAGGTVTGRVVDAVSGRPVAGAALWTPDPAHPNPTAAWMQGDLLSATTDDDGAFRLTGLGAEEAVLRIDAPGYARAHLSIGGFADPSGDGGAPVPDRDVGEIPLDAGSVLLVRAEVAPDAVATATLDLLGRDRSFDQLRAPLVGGVGRFEHVPAGEHRVRVRSGDRLLCESTAVADGFGSAHELTCPGIPLKVEGVVLVAGRPAGVGSLTWQRSGATGGVGVTWTTPEGLTRHTAYGESSVGVKTGPGGAFRTEALATGPWEVVWVGFDGRFGTAVRVELPPGDAVYLEIPFPEPVR